MLLRSHAVGLLSFEPSFEVIREIFSLFYLLGRLVFSQKVRAKKLNFYMRMARRFSECEPNSNDCSDAAFDHFFEV